MLLRRFATATLIGGALWFAAMGVGMAYVYGYGGYGGYYGGYGGYYGSGNVSAGGGLYGGLANVNANRLNAFDSWNQRTSNNFQGAYSQPNASYGSTRAGGEIQRPPAGSLGAMPAGTRYYVFGGYPYYKMLDLWYVPKYYGGRLYYVQSTEPTGYSPSSKYTTIK